MDIRIEKTERAIKNAFLELRSRKPLGKITVKELCSLAAINKSTFYSHYEDIYALSDKMESETIVSVLKNISSQQEEPFKNPDVFTRNLYMALISNNTLINLLFSGTEKARLGDCLETELKRLICEKYPDYKEDPQRDIMLSFCIQGCFHAYLNNQEKDVLAEINASIPLKREFTVSLKLFSPDITPVLLYLCFHRLMTYFIFLSKYSSMAVLTSMIPYTLPFRFTFP